MAESARGVYVEPIGTSTESWGEGRGCGLRAPSSFRGSARAAEVSELDLQIMGRFGQALWPYRAKVKVGKLSKIRG